MTPPTAHCPDPPPPIVPQIAAFGLEVVGGPFVLVGNSIGGYLALAAAARLGPGGHRW